MTTAGPSRGDLTRFLSTHHGEPVEDLEPLSAGFWSSAYGYRAGGQELVLRLGSLAEGFAMDRAAMRFGGPDLPVPEVLDLGEALGCSYAISVRHRGRFLESVAPTEAAVAGPMLLRLLDGLRSAPTDQADPRWWDPEGADWHRWLLDGLVDDPSRHVSGWRSRIAADADLDRLFRACETRIRGLLEACPQRRDLVHGDLLHRNVLVTPDASAVTAVFSWKCATLGDYLYDTAWCTFWGRWHPGIGAVDAFSLVVDSLRRRGAADGLTDAAIRHHCYELQIGAGHLGWYAWTGDEAELRTTAIRTAELLERGPRADRES